jgi:hypothetical protein
MPLTFVNAFVCVNHATFSLSHAIHPVAIVAIFIFVEECTTAVLLVLKPVTGVFTTQFFCLEAPVSSLTVALINRPHTFVLIAVFVVLNAKALLAVVAPVTDVTG